MKNIYHEINIMIINNSVAINCVMKIYIMSFLKIQLTGLDYFELLLASFLYPLDYFGLHFICFQKQTTHIYLTSFFLKDHLFQ